MASPRYLKLDDIRSRIGADVADRLFSQPGSGSKPDPLKVNTILTEAEAMAESELLRGWSFDEIGILMQNDEFARGQAAWIAAELASESKHEFNNPDGWGRYKVQFERAQDHFKRMADSQVRTRAEGKVSKSANSGGKVQPSMPANERQFVFAPSNNAKTGHGGF